ncbi:MULTISPECIES: diacylglycerol kinase family protein [unclassified Roseitalea]|uniref:diacylglycerol/lipid kinase family protein n=1 Tax=unclassified Roseitalea TaxID=2639107 RepID=UPI00273FF099|nr:MULTISPECIES: diacylglycerol kinase family protein [unclassified Roseitalea]
MKPRPGPAPRRVAAVINADASTLKTADIDALETAIRAALGAGGHTVDLARCEGAELVATLNEAAGSAEHDAVLIAGGDGTVSLAAGLCAQAGKTLVVVPGGNMNLFARSLGLPLDPLAAAEALGRAETRKVDIAYAGDRPFIHELSLGLHPELIEERDRRRYGSRLGKLVGTARAALKLIQRPPHVRIWLDTGDGARAVDTPGLAISNNMLGSGHLPYADRLDQGVLGVYVVTSDRPADVAALATGLQTGTWQELDFVRCERARSVRVMRWRSMKAAIDGELVRLEGPVDIRIAPGALSVLAPVDRSVGAVRQTD